MGLTELQKRLIRSIAESDAKSTKNLAAACLDEDKTEKNKSFCARYKSALTSTIKMFEIPQNIKGLIECEDVSISFNERRYYLSPREKDIYHKINKMSKVSEMFRERGIPYSNSVLLHGVSGGGKTSFGRYVAYKSGLPFCYINFSSLVESYMGNTSKNISKVFRFASENPCVLMLDEIDCISVNRSVDDGSSAQGEMARTTISLMQEFDKLPNSAIVIGATNRIDLIDRAILRRFTTKHEVLPLLHDEMREMVDRYLGDIDVNIQDTQMEAVMGCSVQSDAINLMLLFVAEKFMNTVEDAQND